MRPGRAKNQSKILLLASVVLVGAVALPSPSGGARRLKGTSSGHVKYLAWYMDSGLDTAPTSVHANLQMNGNLSLLLESKKKLGLPGLLNLQKSQWANRHRDHRPGTHPYIWNDKGPLRLSPDWAAAVDELVQTLTPLAPAHADTLRGVMIGDELVCGQFPLKHLSVLAGKLRAALSPVGMFIYTNECFRMGAPCKTDKDCATQGSGAGPATCVEKTCHPAKWPDIPAGLDHISLDVYSSGAKEGHLAATYAKKFFFPLLQAHQSVWLVPGMFGRNGTKANATAMAAEDMQLLEKLDSYWAFAQSEPRITGLIPWHWGDLGKAFKPARMTLGGSDFPKTMAKMAQIRRALPSLAAHPAAPPWKTRMNGSLPTAEQRL